LQLSNHEDPGYIYILFSTIGGTSTIRGTRKGPKPISPNSVPPQQCGGVECFEQKNTLFIHIKELHDSVTSTNLKIQKHHEKQGPFS
jgi:hypothetical protein